MIGRKKESFNKEDNLIGGVRTLYNERVAP